MSFDFRRAFGLLDEEAPELRAFLAPPTIDYTLPEFDLGGAMSDYLSRVGVAPLVAGWQTAPLVAGQQVAPLTFGAPDVPAATAPLVYRKQRAGAQSIADSGTSSPTNGPSFGSNAPGAGGSSSIWEAIDAASDDERVRQAMRLAVMLESGGRAEAVGDQGQSHGYYQIYQAAHGRNITPEQSRDPVASTRYMLPEFQRAVGRVDANLWQTDPMRAAALAAFYAERPAQMYDDSRVQQSWQAVQQRQTALKQAGATPQAAKTLAGLTPDQFNSGLDTATALSACGPAAAIAFARATGRNPTMQEAVALARQVGWNPTQGMAGPQSQVALLQKMGVGARLEQGIDWQRVAQEVAAGRPVIIDTPQHYWVVEGYDPATGRFDFGNSARALKATRGQTWLTPQQMAAINRPRSTIYLGG